MSEDISGFGLRVLIVATESFPVGFELTQFADDADPLDLPEVQLGDSAMGLNGDLVTWSTASPIPMNINLIPDSDDERNMAALAELNRVGKGKKAVLDEITATVIYPNNPIPVVLTGGKLVASLGGTSIASSGRKKSKSYNFVFENKVGI